MNTSQYHLEQSADPSRLGHDAPEERPAGFGLVSRIAYLAASLLLVAAIFASINPQFGFHNEALGFNARIWPWEVFVDERASWWTRESAWVLAMAGSAAALAACAFLRPTGTRARLALLVTAIVATTLLPNEPDLLPGYAMNLLLGALLGAAIAADLVLHRATALRVAAVVTVVLGVLLFFPLSLRQEETGIPPNVYISRGVGMIEAFADALGPNPGVIGRTPPPEPKDIHASVGNLAPVFLPEITWILGTLIGALVALRVGRGWARFALGLVVLVAIAGPPAVIAQKMVDEERLKRPPEVPLTREEVVRHAQLGAGVTLIRLGRLALLPLALGLADLLRSRRRS